MTAPANGYLIAALAQALEALRSSAGPEERMNALRDGKAALAKARTEQVPDPDDAPRITREWADGTEKSA